MKDMTPKEKLAARCGELTDLCWRIISDAVPATDSGQTCFVPKYQLEKLAAYLSQLGAMVEAREVFRIAGGDVECEPNPSAESALACLRQLRESYDESLSEHGRGGEATPPDANWCRTCGRHRNDPVAILCHDGCHDKLRKTDATPPTPSAPEMADQPVVPAQGLATATAERILAQREEILRAFVAKYGFQPDEAVQVLGQDGTWRIERRTPSAPVEHKGYCEGYCPKCDATLDGAPVVDDAMVARAEAYMLRVLPNKSTACLGGSFNFHELLTAALSGVSAPVVYACPKCGTGMEVDPAAKPSAPVVMLTGYQLRAALNFIAPDRDDDQLSQEVAIQWGPAREHDEGRDEAGLFCWCAECPDEGSIRLDEKPIPGRDGLQYEPSAPVVDVVANAAFTEFKGGQMVGETESMFWTRIARAALSGVSAPMGVDAEELRRALCQIGIVGNIDGHDVIRRESVLDIIDRRRAALTPAAVPRVECDGLGACNKPDCSVHASAASEDDGMCYCMGPDVVCDNCAASEDGLPEPALVFHTLDHACDFADGVELLGATADFYSADQMRAYGEQCRRLAASGQGVEGWMRDRKQVEELASHLENVGWAQDERGDVQCMDQGAAMAAEVVRKVLLPMIPAAPTQEKANG